MKKYSGKDYQIIPYKVEGGGVARPEGYVMIDIPAEALALEAIVGIVVHEWGHQALGHAKKSQPRPGGGFSLQVSR